MENSRGRGPGLQRATGKKQVEAEEIPETERPKMKTKSSFFGTLMKSSTVKSVKKNKKADLASITKAAKGADQAVTKLRQTISSTAIRPSHPSVLSSYTLEELRLFCQQSSLDYSSYEGQDDEKKHLVEILTATYPPDPVRHHYLRMLELEEYVNLFKERTTEYKKLKEQIKLNHDTDTPTPTPPTHSEEIMTEVNNLFELLLTKFGVTRVIKEKLMKSFSVIEKIKHLKNSVCVLDDDQNFMEEDEEMITIMDSDRFIDSIRLLTCKYRIMNSTPEWLSNFCTSGGISVLVENMDNRLDKDPMEATDAAALLQLIYSLKHIMQTDGLNVAIATRGAIDAFCMSLRFEYQTLALEVLEILAVVCTFGGNDGVIQTVMGLHHLARVRNEKPFTVLVDALNVQNPQIQTAVLALVNAMMTVNIELPERIAYRNELRAVGFNECVSALTARLNGNKDSKFQDLARQESADRLSNRGELIKFQPGMNISHIDVEKCLAEDGVTLIHPEQGIMAGICWEAKKSKSEVKKRWYEVKGGVFSWYHLEERQKDINCEPNGQQEMASVVEIMGYSTSPDLQRMFKYCFVFQCSDGQRFQFGVQDQITKQRWIVALQTSMARASQERTAYTIENHVLPKDQIHLAKQSFNKQLEIYNGIESADRELFMSACKEGLISKSEEIAGYMQQNFLFQGRNEGPLIEAEYLKMLGELLVATIETPSEIRDILVDITTAIHMHGHIDTSDLVMKNGPKHQNEGDLYIQSLLAENEALRGKLLANPEKKSKSKWKEMLGLAKRSKDSVPEPVERKLSLDIKAPSERVLVPVPPVEKSLLPLASIHEAPPVTPEKTEAKMPTPTAEAEPQKGKVEAAASIAQMFAQRAPPPPEPEPQKGKVEAAASLAQMFAQRAPPPPEPEPQKGKVEAAASLAQMFAQRALPPPEPVSSSSGEDTISTSESSLAESMREEIREAQHRARSELNAIIDKARSAGLHDLVAEMERDCQGDRIFSDRSGPPLAGPGNLAVTSSRPIPIPPYLPGQAPQVMVAPRMPGQQVTQPLLPSKPKIIPNVKMRQFQWLPLKPEEAINTVWTEITEPTIEEYVSELEDGYSRAVKSDGMTVNLKSDESATASKISADKKSKPKKETLFDGRRTQNISITMGKLKKSPDEVTTLITELKPDILTTDLALTLLPLCPTPDDVKLIRGYEGKDEDLDIPGRVMSRLVDIPRLEQRLKTHITTLTWEDSASKLENKLDALGDAVEELREDSSLGSLKEIFSLILAIGNYLNGGTNKGQAQGIKLNGLLKLVECRRNGSKTETLLHQVVKFYRLTHTDEELFYSQWINVWAAKNLSVKQLEVEVRELDNALLEVKKELAESDKIVEEALKIPLKRNLKAFLAVAVDRQQKIVDTLTEVKRIVTEIRQYFGDTSQDKEEDGAQVFFKTMTEFAVQYMKAIKEIDEWAEQERKAKEAAIKAEAEKQRRASISLPTMNVGLLKINHAPSAAGSGVNAFRLYEQEQALSSEDHISFFKKQMMDRRGAMTQGGGGAAGANKGVEILEESETEESESEDEAEAKEWKT